MRKSILLPGLAVLGGAAGAVLRRWQIRSAYHADTQLFDHGAPATYALLGLTAVLLVLFLLLCRPLPRYGDFLPAFRIDNAIHMTLCAAAGFVFFAAGIFGLLEGMGLVVQWRTEPGSVLITYAVGLALCGVLCFPAGLASLLLGQAAYRGKVGEAGIWLSSFPALAGLVWLFTSHLHHGTDPVLLHYGFYLAAVALLMLCQYDRAAFFYGRSHPTRLCVSGLMGVYLGILSLADFPSRFSAAMTAAFLLSALACVSDLLEPKAETDPT